MATLNGDTLDRSEYTLFYRVNQQNIPVQLPFRIVTVDKDFQYYEPAPLSRFSDNIVPLRGSVVDAVYLTTNQRLPVPTNSGPSAVGVWEYYGY